MNMGFIQSIVACLDPLTVTVIFVVVGIMLLLAAFSRREYRKVDAERAQREAGLARAEGIDEPFSHQLAPLDQTAEPAPGGKTIIRSADQP